MATTDTNAGKFRIQRRIEIDAAHRVPDHSSKCYNVHGHRYVIEAECEGLLFIEGEQKGMVLDFGFMKDIMMKRIHFPCDHGLILYNQDELMLDMVYDSKGIRKGVKLLILPYVPTAENLAMYWFEQMYQDVTARSDGKAALTKVIVHETPNCKAEYPL